ncbi:MAG: cupin domain-containing protein [Acidimicrobiia bacterium]
MSQSTPEPIDLAERFIYLATDGRAFPFAPTGSYWAGTEPTEGGRSVGAVAFTSSEDLHHRLDERHAGTDEVIILGAGQLEIWLDLPDGARTATITPGQAVVVPADTWHRLVARQPGWLIFCNRRSGIESRPHPGEETR